MLNDVGHAFGSDGRVHIFGGVHLTGQEERRVTEPEQRGRGHLGVQVGPAGHGDAGWYGRDERHAIRIQQVVPVRVPEPPVRVEVQEERQVQRRRPVPGSAEIEQQRVGGTSRAVVPEHHVVPVEIAMAQDGQRFPWPEGPSHGIVAVLDELCELARVLRGPVPVVPRQQPVQSRFTVLVQRVVFEQPLAVVAPLRVANVGHGVSEPDGIFAFGHIRQPVEP